MEFPNENEAIHKARAGASVKAKNMQVIFR